MCETCGCNHNEMLVAENVLENNNKVAAENKKILNSKQILTINMMGSPGSGKTTFIIKTIEALKSETDIYVIEGDQFGSLDSDRISKTGVNVLQINTGNGCHLDAMAVNRAIKKLKPSKNSLLIIENVGNLVCPALFNLGEHQRVVVFSVTEGDDKPIKYAPMFHEATHCIINKTDLMDFVPFDHNAAMRNLGKINHKLHVFSVSALKGTNMAIWIDSLKKALGKL